METNVLATVFAVIALISSIIGLVLALHPKKKASTTESKDEEIASLKERITSLENELSSKVSKRDMITNFAGFRTNDGRFIPSPIQRCSGEVPDPEHKFTRMTPYGDVYPINYYYADTEEAYINADYEKYNSPVEIERLSEGRTDVFFGKRSAIKDASEDRVYSYEWGKTTYYAKKAEMTEEEFYGHINKYNRHPDTGVEN